MKWFSNTKTSYGGAGSVFRLLGSTCYLTQEKNFSLVFTYRGAIIKIKLFNLNGFIPKFISNKGCIGSWWGNRMEKTTGET